MPDAPIESISPSSTETPLNASVPEPGMYGYAIASANTQTANVANRRVGRAESASSQSTSIRRDWTPSKKFCSRPLTKRARRKITTTISSSGTDCAIAVEQIDDRRDEERVELLAPRAREREAAEHESDPLVGQQQDDGPEADPQQLPDKPDRAAAVQELGAADPELPRRRIGQVSACAG